MPPFSTTSEFGNVFDSALRGGCGTKGVFLKKNAFRVVGGGEPWRRPSLKRSRPVGTELLAARPKKSPKNKIPPKPDPQEVSISSEAPDWGVSDSAGDDPSEIEDEGLADLEESLAARRYALSR